MSTFDSWVSFAGMRFHLWTLLTLIGLFIFVLFRNGERGIWRFVVASLSVTLSVHLYEVHHGLFQFIVSDYVGESIWFNFLCLIVLFILLLTFLKNPTRNFIMFVPFYVGFIISMCWLASTGFFINYPDNIQFGIEWAISKVFASISMCSMFTFIREKTPCESVGVRKKMG